MHAFISNFPCALLWMVGSLRPPPEGAWVWGQRPGYGFRGELLEILGNAFRQPCFGGCPPLGRGDPRWAGGCLTQSSAQGAATSLRYVLGAGPEAEELAAYGPGPPPDLVGAARTEWFRAHLTAKCREAEE